MIAESGVRKMIWKLKVNKTSEPDEIGPKVLKNLESSTALIDLLIFYSQQTQCNAYTK